MIAVFRKEIASFFSSPVGYLVTGSFLVLTGLFLFVFKGPFNLLDYGFADLSLFFLLAPWAFLLLIPALSMRAVSEERKLGTLELLLSKPLSLPGLLLGKFLGVFVLVFLSVVPTLLYVYTVYQLGMEPGNLDMGLVWGSYLGLFLLMAAYTAMGLFASSLTDNQIVAFLLGLLLCFGAYIGFESLAGLFADGGSALWVADLGMKAHYENISQGVLDSRDMVYFLSLTAFFLWLTAIRINRLRQ
ncbi:gliding motility-associated ABC transporter permease subunit GldF [Robiginitalea sp. M366]|uniref:gliding motility-associated ABC transporter permease subunit GldF n=1 Tax=Robiginitalea aestuariiviva TaxID=3036903 RepID=UPI00240D5F61|nr:gliding motility-associated ABC transporter permease subunit GldF [Robiginitalea aestuariiviva]MDG1572759.1 gliding motility-associated ABC transporter permease subunit GldF [Robiginitalea aestuariiviva]